MIEGGLRDILGESKMNRIIAGLKDHYIVCGFGRIGKEICKILHDNHRPFVVIENDPEQVSHVEKLGYVEMHGEAADDEILIAAGIKRAQGLIAVVSTDADNVYITLTARGLNPNLQIIARSSEARGSETKLLRAGANKVISPYSIGARRMAQLIVRPTVMDFLDLTMHTGDLGLRLEELRVSEKAGIANKSLMDSKLRSKYDMIVVAIKRKDGEMLFNPKPATMILPGDVLVVLGELDQIKAMEMAV
jgi:voltage-gated potassium channel